MPDLFHTLLKYDLGQLKIIADLWGIELSSRQVQAAAEELCAPLLDPATVRETLDTLPPQARAAMNGLLAANGRLEWAVFTREFGAIREMGAGKRDRERPQLDPSSAAEVLFYRGLMARAFFETERGPQEFAFIPDDMLPLLRLEGGESTERRVLGRPATPVERSFERPATDRILDQATTLLAALRTGKADFSPDARLPALLTSAKILKKNIPQAEAVKSFLACSREAGMDLLYQAWIDSTTYNELQLIPGLACEGEWTNSPRTARGALLKFIDALPAGKWWSLPAFLRDLKASHPDFQRPAGDYDSWFIKRTTDGEYLRGFAYWEQVDGAVARAVIEMLHWLGRAEVSSAGEQGAISGFRTIPRAAGAVEGGRLGLNSDGRITLPSLFPRAVRYQLARFCEWDESGGDHYKYRITARSLRRADGQGLKAGQLLSLLVKHSNGRVPPPLVQALKRWEANGVEAKIERPVLLKTSRPEILDQLRKSKAGKFLGEILSPTTIVIREGAIQKVSAALAELGLFADVEKEG
jgi:hypothetical protein